MNETSDKTDGTHIEAIQTYSICGKCGGLIAQPNTVYDWAGEWCKCIKVNPVMPLSG